MGRLDHLSLEDLHDLLETTRGETPRERVLVAIARKQGDTIDRLAERHDIAEKTVRNWLDRFADRPLSAAPYDEERPGRPSKLTADERTELMADFQRPPAAFGYDSQSWTASMAARHVETSYGVEYTARHCRALLNEAGVGGQRD